MVLAYLQIDELDYGRRMAAYAALTPAAWQPLSQRQAAPLLHTCLHDLRNAGEPACWGKGGAGGKNRNGVPSAGHASHRCQTATLPTPQPAHPRTHTHPRILTHTTPPPAPTPPTDDLALRHAASQALSRFIEAAAAATATAGEAAEAPEGGTALSAAQRVLFPQLKRGLPAPSLAVRQEHLALLRQLVLAFPQQYREMVMLTGGWVGKGAGGAGCVCVWGGGGWGRARKAGGGRP